MHGGTHNDRSMLWMMALCALAPLALFALLGAEEFSRADAKWAIIGLGAALAVHHILVRAREGRARNEHMGQEQYDVAQGADKKLRHGCH